MTTEEKELPLTERKVMRRGLLAGLAALGAAAMMKVSGARTVEAHDPDDMFLGNPNTVATNNTTQLTAAVTNVPAFKVIAGGTATPGKSGVVGVTDANGGAGVWGFNDVTGGFGVSGDSQNGSGVRGITSLGTGVLGLGTSSSSFAVRAIATTNGTGLKALSNTGNSLLADGDGSGVAILAKSGSGIGVHGKSGSGVGVKGESTSNYSVQGVSTNSVGVGGFSVNHIGVHALSTGTLGVWGQSVNYIGIQGESDTNVGVLGISHTPNFAGVYGASTAAAGPSKLAGFFDGNVFITGNQTVLGGKSAVVPHPDGSMRTLYCQESPEAWFEDFGRAQLVGGVARVRLDPDFAALVHIQGYHVFPSPEGNCSLFVSQQDANGFEIREVGAGKSNVPFSYRVVAKRRDIPAPRLAKVDTRSLTPLPLKNATPPGQRRSPSGANLPSLASVLPPTTPGGPGGAR